MPSHYLNQCLNIFNWSLMNKPRWRFKRNSYISTQENTFKCVVCEIVAILSRPQWVKEQPHAVDFITHRDQNLNSKYYLDIQIGWKITTIQYVDFYVDMLKTNKTALTTSSLTNCILQWSHSGRDGVSNHRRLVCLHMQPFDQAWIKENIKAPRHWPLWGEFTGDRWIPPTKSQ